MLTTVDLAPGAEENRLAAHLAASIRAAIADDARGRAFRALKATVLVVPFDEGDAVTLRFDFGRLVVHDGNVGVPTITIGGPHAELLRLTEVGQRGLGDFLLSLLGRRPRHPLRSWLRLVAAGDVRLYGMMAHPRTAYRFLRTLVVPEAS